MSIGKIRITNLYFTGCSKVITKSVVRGIKIFFSGILLIEQYFFILFDENFSF